MIAIACIGDCQHGKTALLSAISHVLPGTSMTIAPMNSLRQPPPASPDAVPMLNKAPVERLTGLTTIPQQPHIYEFEGRTFAHFDCPSIYTRNAARCLALSDFAILVLSAVDGPEHGTRRQLAMAEAMGIRHLVVFLSKFDDLSPEEQAPGSFWFELLNDELQAMMPEAYQGAPYVAGSAHDAIRECLDDTHTATGRGAIEALLEHLRAFPAPLHDPHVPFRFWVQQVFSIVGRGTALGGRVVAGSLSAGQPIEFRKDSNYTYAQAPFTTTNVRSLVVNRQYVERVNAGDLAGLLLVRIKRAEVRPGTLITAPHQRRPGDLAWRVKMRLALLPREDEQRVIRTGYSPQFQAGTMVTDGRIALNQASLTTGESAEVEVAFAWPMAIPPHRKMLVCDHGMPIGVGHDVELLEASPAHWLWYQAESQETLVHLRDVLCGPPTQAMWQRLVDLYCGMSLAYPEDEGAQLHRQICSAYVLDHIRGWAARLPASNLGDPVGLWRRVSPVCVDDGSDGLGHFLEIRKRGHWFDARDVFLTPNEDLTDVMRQVMFARVWKMQGPRASLWHALCRCREGQGWVLSGGLGYLDGHRLYLHSELRIQASGLLERSLSGGRDESDKKQATKQLFARIATFEDGQGELRGVGGGEV